MEWKGKAGIAGVARKAYIWLWITYIPPYLMRRLLRRKATALPGVFSVASSITLPT